MKAWLTAFAILALATPVIAADSCTHWSAADEEDEGGPVLKASACASDDSRVFLSLSCADGRVGISYDLAMGAEKSPDSDETATVNVTIGPQSFAVPFAYREMDGMFAGDVAVDDPLIAALRAGSSAHLDDGPGLYPDHDYALDGTNAAIGTLLENCR